MDKGTTSHLERQNLTMRHVNGRLRRLCLAFSKKLDNHRAAVALAYTWYNLGHVVKTLRVTPAMAAGVTDHVWTIAEFMEAALDLAPVEKPVAQPLAHRVPVTTSRELPGGRGFLRVVGGTSSSGAPPAGPVPPPGAPAVHITVPVASGRNVSTLLRQRARAIYEGKVLAAAVTRRGGRSPATRERVRGALGALSPIDASTTGGTAP